MYKIKKPSIAGTSTRWINKKASEKNAYWSTIVKSINI